jgi:hypothetical protein
MKRRRFIEVTSIGSAVMATNLYFKPLSEDRKLKIGLIGANGINAGKSCKEFS